MLSALMLTSPLVVLTVACESKKTEEKKDVGEKIDIDSLNSEMIINWKDKYEVEIGKEKIEADKLNTLKNSAIMSIIKQNTYDMVSKKITGANEAQWKSFNGLDDTVNDTVISDSMLKNMTIFRMLSSPLSEDPANNLKQSIEKLIANIILKKWDDLKEAIQKKANEITTLQKEITTKSENELKENFKLQYKNGRIPEDKVLEKQVKRQIQAAKQLGKLDLDSFKAIYDLIQIKGESRAIEINLNPSK